MIKSVKNNNNRDKKKITPDSYLATITAVREPSDFDKDNAIDVFYDVQKDGHIIKYRERFFLIDSSERLQKFETVLDELDLENYEDLVGVKLRLTFKFQVKMHTRFCNIVGYSVVKGADEDAYSA